MKLNEKKQIVVDLADRLRRSTIVIATDYKGLNVSSISDLRRKLREANAEYQVAKNSLLVRASENTDVAKIREYFKGPTAIAVSYDDPVAPAKVLTQFAKTNDKLGIKAAVLNGKLIGVEGIKALSDLPSREVLLAQVLSTMNAVPSALVRALADVPRRMVTVLQAIKEQKEAA